MTTGTTTEPLATRIVSRLRLPILAAGLVASGLLAARLLGLGVPNGVTGIAAGATGVPALVLFFCALLDRRFHNALSVVNAEQSARARARGGLAGLAGLGRPTGDSAFQGLGAVLTVLVLIAGFQQDGPAGALAFSASCLVVLGAIANLTRGRPTDRFVD